MAVRCVGLILIAALAAGCQSAAPPPGASVDAAGLRLALPAGWQAVPPSSAMRKAQVMIPGPDGVGELAVFHFGIGQGGDVEANFQRWLGQIEIAAGSTPQREVIEAGDLRITWIDATGTLRAGQMGMGPATAQPGARLYGAVVEGPGGPWFIKATGPDGTLAAQREAWLAMLRSASVDRGS